MDIVLGVSMAPTVIRTVLVEGANADGVTVDEKNFDVASDHDAATISSADQVISTILGTRENATQAGYALASTGVTWTDPLDAAALREALATRKVENVMLVSAFMAAAALAQMVGSATGNVHTALLFVEPETATLAVVDSADGSITDIHKEPISSADTVTELAGMVAGLDSLATRPEHLFVVGSGVDIAALKPKLEAVTSLPVSAPEEPETALAWGAALASANAPLFASSTAALAYAQDPATGEVDPYAVSPGYLAVPDVPPGTELGEEDLAYSAVPDEEAEANTTVVDLDADEHRERRPLLLVGTILAVVVVAAALALEVSLALGIRPSVALLPRPLQNLIVPTQQAPAPPPAALSAPAPQVNHVQAPVVAPRPPNAPIPAPPPAAPLLPPVPAAPPAPVVAPRVPVLVPLLPPVPAAPPAPVVAPRVPVLVPLPLPIPAGPPSPGHLPGASPGHLPGSSPGNLPGRPPVSTPAPVHLPVPQPALNLPAPQSPVHVVGPQPPIQLPAPEAPVHVPAPEAPVAPVMPAPEAPVTPVMPAPEAPRAAPQAPGVNAPTIHGPSGNPFSDGVPTGHGFGGFGGGHW